VVVSIFSHSFSGFWAPMPVVVIVALPSPGMGVRYATRRRPTNDHLLPAVGVVMPTQEDKATEVLQRPDMGPPSSESVEQTAEALADARGSE
jgi:hypothetical protein